MGLSNTLPRYVQQRQSGYYFRYAVPLRLRPVVGQGELKYSLKTRSKRTAQHRASRLAGLLYEALHSMNPTDVTPERIRQLVQAEVAKWERTASDAALDESPKTPQQAAQLARFYDMAAQESRLRLATGDFSDPTLEASIHGLLKPEGVSLPAYQVLHLGIETADLRAARLLYNRLAREYVQAEAAFNERQAAMRRGETPAVYTGPPPSPTVVDEPPSVAAPTLSSLWGKFTKEKLTQREWSANTHEANEATFTEFLDIVGDIPVAEVSRDTMVDYLGKLQRLPKGTLKAYRGASVPELLGRDIPASDRRSSRTVKEALGRIKGFFGWCHKGGLIDPDPATSVSIKSQSKRRELFTAEDLNRLFYSEQYRDGTHRKSWQFWMPLLALYTGARQNELAQLYLKNITEVDGTAAFDITDQEEGTSVKTAAGFRKVPIHPVLLDIGFMDYVAALRNAGEERLFPDLAKGTRRWGQAVSQWFNREDSHSQGYMLKCGVDKNDGRKVFHSFRHTVITHLLRVAKVPLQEVQPVVGHEQSLMGATKHYYHSTFEDAVRVVERLDFGLDHSGIKGQWRKYIS